jgi:hypothetical protein
VDTLTHAGTLIQFLHLAAADFLSPRSGLSPWARR